MTHENTALVGSDELHVTTSDKNIRKDDSKLKLTYGIYKELLSTYSSSWENMKAYKTLSVFGAFVNIILIFAVATIITGAISDAIIAPLYDLTFVQKMGIPGALTAVLMSVFIFFMDRYRVNHIMCSAGIKGYRKGKMYLLRAGIAYAISLIVFAYIMFGYSQYMVDRSESNVPWFSSVFDLEYIYTAGAAQAVMMLPIILVAFTIILGFCFMVYAVVMHRRVSGNVRSMVGLNTKLRDGYIHIS